MDSLLSNYGSSEEEEEEDENPKPKPSHFFSLPPLNKNLISSPNPNFHTQNQILDKPTSLFSSLPKPNSSYSQFSPPSPKSNPLQKNLISPPNPNFETQNQNLDKPTSLFSSLPKPNSSSSQLSILPRKSNLPQQTLISPQNPNFETQNENLEKPTSLFSSLPKPNSSSSQFSILPPPNPKKIVQFKPPVMKTRNFNDDDGDEDGDIETEWKKESFPKAINVSSFLSDLLPAAKNSSSTLGALPSALGSSRRSIVETNVSQSNSASFSTEAHVGTSSYEVNYTSFSNETQVDISSNEVNYGGSLISSEYGVSGGGNYQSYAGNGGYGNYNYYGQYNNSSEVGQSSVGGVGESVMKVPGKRGRNEIPTEIVKVKQDDLTMNRPREDQVKSTGIAFGPAYQPVSTKGKPSKLQKRKHQIGSLYFDMRQKESELAERRSKGFLTKAETQAKYGW